MRLELERAEFLKAWQTAEKYTPSKTTMDALNCVRITANEDSVTLEATDLKSAVKCTAKGAAVIEPGTVVLNAAIFGNMLRKTTASTLTLEAGDERGTLKADRSRSRFTVIPPDSFPNIPASTEAEDICEIMASDLALLIVEGSCAASAPSDFPKYLGTCLLRTEDSYITAVSTDGKRLALAKTLCSSVNKQAELIVPSAALKELGKLFTTEAATVKILADSSTVWFMLDGAEFSLRRIDATFPKYEKILNNEVKTIAKVDKKALLSALDRIDIIAKNNPAHIMAMEIQTEGELRITARAPEIGTASETLEATVEGDHMHIGFNVTYFLDGIKAVSSDAVSIEFSAEEGQTRMLKDDGDDFLYMLMPVRLSPQDVVNDDEAQDFIAPSQPESEVTNDEGQQEESPQASEEPHEFGEGNYDSEAPF